MRFSTTTSPKCTGSMPSCRTAGISTGIAIRIAAVGSRKQPTNSNSRLTSSRNTHAELVNPSTHVVTMSVTRVAVSSQPKIDAAATMKSTVAVVSMVSIDTFTSILNDRVRYQTTPRNSAQIDAATAPSVGVKMPVVMPPINSTGVMIGSTASNLNFQSAPNNTIIATPVASGGLAPISTAPQITSGNAITITSSSI